ncbi:hypothetical protein F4777DRAFT_276589 [Nemania sp. FL0916]|nr:hypothetical protein F4777DRAFT_276589 [Nemania sp. FL0916]
MDLDDQIDSLLERYLHLLHEYTTLREELTTLQTGMYQNIARANFAAERGLRFGQDHYDGRMQASRRLAIDYKSQDRSESKDKGDLVAARLSGVSPSFAIVNPDLASEAEDSGSNAQDPKRQRPGAEAKAKTETEKAETESAEAKPARSSAPSSQAQGDPNARVGEDDAKASTTSGSTHRNLASPSSSSAARNKGSTAPPKPTDPLRWFGLLTPAPLRQAQASSVRAVEHVIPRLASVSAEMAEVEIEVRRARKRRAKADVAAMKKMASQDIHGQDQDQRRVPEVRRVAT